MIDLVAKRMKKGLHVVGAANDPTVAGESIDAPVMAVEIDNATLRYPLGAFDRGSLKTILFSLFGGRRPPRTQYVDALRNFSLRVTQGERVAIIGHNGSGKSTLLRTLAGIYPLSSGAVTVVGRISALLDNTLGFEPEATGRENIYYRGTTMGLSRKELQKFEQEIVDFADIGEFIDLPMRTYSAGMCVRLGFSVSTQFSPDILLIDEIFGAGDASFAKKALARMMTIVDHAGIVIIATHDLGLIERVCKRVIWLERGTIVMDGAPEAILPEYRKHMLGAVT